MAKLPEKIDLKAFERAIERNRKERLRFISRWVSWMKRHPRKWSKEQNKVIDWQMKRGRR